MPKLTCPCGFVHDLSPIPDHGWKTVRDVDYDELLEAEKAADPARVVALYGLLYDCPQCARVLWSPPGSTTFRVYALERDAL